MKIGIPRENKVLEGRVSLIPDAVSDLVKAGHDVFVEQGAGSLSGYADEDYVNAGARILPDSVSVYAEASLIVKVKEPIEADLQQLTCAHTVFSFLHLAPQPELTERLKKIGLTAIGFETVTDRQGGLPLLAPMSQIAGRVATQIGTHLLHEPQGGKGLLLGGIAGTERGHVVVLGGGNAGASAAALAAQMGAQVTVFDKDNAKLERLRTNYATLTTLYPYNKHLAAAVTQADLLIGAVLIPGAETPHIVSRAMVEQMQAGSVIIDISVDQGGCIETTHPTDYAAPTYRYADVIHFGVTNMPGAVPRTASQALSAVLTPYVMRLAEQGVESDEGLKNGLQVQDGAVCHPALMTG